MKGLEILLFGAFVIFAVVNLLIRFLVRKAKGKAGAVSDTPPSDASWAEEAGVSETPPDFPPMRQIGGTIDASKPEDRGLFSPATGIHDEEGVVEELKRDTMSVSGGRTIPAETKKAAARSAAGEKQPGVGRDIEEHTKRFRGTIEVRKEKEIHHENFWERMDKLPSLQRAIVLAEVLGPSKGIDS